MCEVNCTLCQNLSRLQDGRAVIVRPVGHCLKERRKIRPRLDSRDRPMFGVQVNRLQQRVDDLVPLLERGRIPDPPKFLQ